MHNARRPHELNSHPNAQHTPPKKEKERKKERKKEGKVMSMKEKKKGRKEGRKEKAGRG